MNVIFNLSLNIIYGLGENGKNIKTIHGKKTQGAC